MVFAFLYQLSLKYKIIDDSNTDNLFSRGMSTCLVFLGLLGLGVSIPILCCHGNTLTTKLNGAVIYLCVIGIDFAYDIFIGF